VLVLRSAATVTAYHSPLVVIARPSVSLLHRYTLELWSRRRLGYVDCWSVLFLSKSTLSGYRGRTISSGQLLGR